MAGVFRYYIPNPFITRHNRGGGSLSGGSLGGLPLTGGSLGGGSLDEEEEEEGGLLSVDVPSAMVLAQTTTVTNQTTPTNRSTLPPTNYQQPSTNHNQPISLVTLSCHPPTPPPLGDPYTGRSTHSHYHQGSPWE